MTTAFHKIPCPRCGTLRNPNLNIPCELCRSRKIPFFGYTYGIEASSLAIIFLLLFGFCILAFVLGAIFIYLEIFELKYSDSSIYFLGLTIYKTLIG